MTDHDPLCDHGDCEPDDCSWAEGDCGACAWIRMIRADEHEQVISRVGGFIVHGECDGALDGEPCVCDAQQVLAAIRGEASDD